MRAVAFALCIGCFIAGPLAAQEAPRDDDFSRIPQASVTNPADDATSTPGVPAAGRAIQRVRMELVAGQAQLRGGGRSGQFRADLDIASDWRFAPNWRATLSDRLQDQRTDDGPARNSAANDLREAYVTWSGPGNVFVDAGRVNVRNGVGLGWNPTDYLKPGTSIALASADPTEARGNRLGVAMLRIQKLGARASFGLAVAPQIASHDPSLRRTPAGFGPHFDRTNSTARYLATVGVELADLSPQFLLFDERGVQHFGIDVSKPIGTSAIAYAEWSGAWERDLIARAYEYGRRTGDLPATLAPLSLGDGQRHFYNDVAVGASYVLARRLTVNAEYHYHGAGLSGRRMDEAFALSAREPSTLGQEFWYVRGYAADRREPLARQQFFLRMAIDHLVARQLSASAVVFRNAHDGSTYAQLSATYDMNDAYSVSAYAGSSSGRMRTEYGSLPASTTFALALNRTF